MKTSQFLHGQNFAFLWNNLEIFFPQLARQGRNGDYK